MAIMQHNAFRLLSVTQRYVYEYYATHRLVCPHSCITIIAPAGCPFVLRNRSELCSEPFRRQNNVASRHFLLDSPFYCPHCAIYMFAVHVLWH